MTLEQSKMQKVMVLTGTFTDINDLTEFWFKVYPFKTLTLAGRKGEYSIEFKGDWCEGLYVLGCVVTAVRAAKADCHLEVKAEYV